MQLWFLWQFLLIVKSTGLNTMAKTHRLSSIQGWRKTFVGQFCFNLRHRLLCCNIFPEVCRRMQYPWTLKFTFSSLFSIFPLVSCTGALEHLEQRSEIGERMTQAGSQITRIATKRDIIDKTTDLLFTRHLCRTKRAKRTTNEISKQPTPMIKGSKRKTRKCFVINKTKF